MISVVIPAYNEEERIEAVLKGLKKLKEVKEIIVVDDGSTDNTGKIAKKYAKVVTHYPNKGKGKAMVTGVKKASKDYIIFFEGDDQLHHSDLVKFIKVLKNEDVDMVVGVRNFNKIPWPRKVNNALTTFALTIATLRLNKDPLSGFMAFKREKFLELDLKQHRYAIESEIHLKAAKKGYKKAYVSVDIKYHDAGNFEFSEHKLNWKQSFLLFLFLLKRVLRWPGN